MFQAELGRQLGAEVGPQNPDSPLLIQDNFRMANPIRSSRTIKQFKNNTLSLMPRPKFRAGCSAAHGEGAALDVGEGML